jgi:hypothetical protein
MPIAHIMAAGMGGIRTAGDLVAWMQMTRRMKIAEAKRYVADKLGIEVIDLTNEDVMYSLWGVDRNVIIWTLNPYSRVQHRDSPLFLEHKKASVDMAWHDQLKDTERYVS